MSKRYIHFGPYVIDLNEHTDEQLREMLLEAENAIDILEDKIAEREDEQQ